MGLLSVKLSCQFIPQNGWRSQSESPHPLSVIAQLKVLTILQEQLKQLLLSAEFPEECFVPCPVRVTGQDERADMVCMQSHDL